MQKLKATLILIKKYEIVPQKQFWFYCTLEPDLEET